MVKIAGDTDFDGVALHGFDATLELGESRTGVGTIATRGQFGAKDVGHLTKFHVAAHGTGLTSFSAQIARHAQEFGVGVTNLVGANSAGLELGDERVANEPVLNHGPFCGRRLLFRHGANFSPVALFPSQRCLASITIHRFEEKDGEEGDDPPLPGLGRPAVAKPLASKPGFVCYHPTVPQHFDEFGIETYVSMYRSDTLVNVLELAILGILMEQDRHGYEIRSQLRDRLGLWSNISFGSLYPALGRLEREGLVEPVLEASTRLGAVSTGSLSGERAALRSLRSERGIGRRGRKVYRLTDAGRAAFVERLADPASLDDARSFSLRMSLARFLTPSVRIGLLEHRRANLVARLRDVRTHAASSELDSYGRSVLQHAASAVELDIAWIDELLTGERTNPHDALGAK